MFKARAVKRLFGMLLTLLFVLGLAVSAASADVLTDELKTDIQEYLNWQFSYGDLTTASSKGQIRLEDFSLVYPKKWPSPPCQLTGSHVDYDVALNRTEKQLRFQLEIAAKPYSLPISGYVSADQLTVDMTTIREWAKVAEPALVEKLPSDKLYLQTGPNEREKVQQFWTELEKQLASKKMNEAQKAAVKEVIALLVNALPNHVVVPYEPKMAGLAVGYSDLFEILTSLQQAMIDHPEVGEQLRQAYGLKNTQKPAHTPSSEEVRAQLERISSTFDRYVHLNGFRAGFEWVGPGRAKSFYKLDFELLENPLELYGHVRICGESLDMLNQPLTIIAPAATADNIMPFAELDQKMKELHRQKSSSRK